MKDRPNIREAFSALNKSYETRKLFSLSARKELLKKFLIIIKENEEAIFKALKEDLGRSPFESYITEIAAIKNEISSALKSLKYWSEPRMVKTPLVFQPGQSYIEPTPKGVVLIIAPWNYPFQLSLVPMISALAAGNCVMIKPSELAMASALILEKLVNSVDQNLVRVINGDAQVAQELLSLSFDHIFYTGSGHVGREVMKKAAENLCPITLELGGKSPVIIDDNCNLELAAKRIMWGKCLNAGQTCVAPDYVLINKKLINNFIALAKNYVTTMYGQDISKHENFGRIINERHSERIIKYLHDGDVALGGGYNIQERFIEPTIMTNIKADAPIMHEEIFGPVLPLVAANNIQDAVNHINKSPRPLALYIFSNDQKNINTICERTNAGGITINDCISHAGIIGLPFGGIGASGMGAYHGQFGFDTFSHMRGVHKRANIFDNPIKYPPYTSHKLSLVRVVM